MTRLWSLIGQANYVVRASIRKLSGALRTIELRSRFDIGNSSFSSEAEILSTRGRFSVKIGDHCHSRGEIFVFSHSGRIEIGNWVYIGARSSIWAASVDGVSIGDRVLIASDVTIHDTNGHPFDSRARFDQTVLILTTGHPEKINDVESKPIIIHSDAWIGTKATILKGVTIGEGAVVGACSVVTRDVEPYTIVAGNPAKVVRRLDPPSPRNG